MNGKQCGLAWAALVGTLGLFAMVGCTSPDAAAEKAYNDATNACERQTRTDQREQCFDAARKKYDAAMKDYYTSTCPKSSC